MHKKRREKASSTRVESSLRPSSRTPRGPIRPQPERSKNDQRITVTPLSVGDFRLLIRSSSAAIVCFELLHPLDCELGQSEFVSNLYERDSVCVEANAAFLEMLQEKELTDILGASIAELLPENRGWPRLFSRWHQGSRSSAPLESALLKQDGDSWTTSCAIYGIHDGPYLRRIWLVARDISAHSAISTAFKDHENHYRNILNTPQSISVRYDLSGLCEYVSASTTSMLGLLHTDRFERPIYVQEIVHPEDVSTLLSPSSLNHFQTAAAPFSIRCRVRDGTFMPFTVRRYKVPSRDTSTAVFDLVGDRADRLQSGPICPTMNTEASACLVHDLNNLLTAAIAQATCSSQSAPNTSLQTLQHTLELCGDLVKKVIGRPEQSPHSNHTIALQDAVQASVQMMRPLLGTDIEITIQAPTSPTMLMSCSPTDITQIVSNLVLNAKEALGKKGRIEIILEPRLSPQEAVPHASLTVRDTGPGIPPDILPKLFHHSVSSKKDAARRGLGLRSVKSIIDRIGGRIIVCSENSGTSIFVKLPLLDLLHQGHEPQLTHTTKPLSIVIADDEPLIRQMFTTVLSSLGHSITTASDGKSLLQTIEASSNIDVVILDDQMPASRASDLAAQLHFKRPEVSIIVASGDPSLRRKMGVLPESVSFLDKPFTRSEIISALSALSRKRGNQHY